MAPLQKRACYSLIIGVTLAAVLAAVFILKGGISTFESDQGFRIIIDLLWIGILVLNLILINLTLRKPRTVDERDRLIMDRAPRIQWLAVVLTMVTWTIALNEIYRPTGQIPTVFLYIIFMSVLIAGTIGQSLGILIGYWSMAKNG
jgi:hypothetical protein